MKLETSFEMSRVRCTNLSVCQSTEITEISSKDKEVKLSCLHRCDDITPGFCNTKQRGNTQSTVNDDKNKVFIDLHECVAINL